MKTATHHPELTADIDDQPDLSATAVRRALTVGGLGAAALAVGATQASAAGQETASLSLLAQIEYASVTIATVAPTLPFVKAVKNPVFGTYLTKSLAQHKESLAALVKAGAAPVTEVSTPVAVALGLDAAAKLKDLPGLVSFAKGLEDKLMQTAVSLGTPDISADNRKLLGQIAASAAQRLAVLRAVEALLSAGHPELIALPPDAAKLPEAAGNIGFPDGFVKSDLALKVG